MKRSGNSARIAAILLIVFCPLSIQSVGAAPFNPELHYRIRNTTQSSSPWITQDILLFTYSAPKGTRVVSLAFEHDNYRILHTYKKNEHGIFILTLPLPENHRELTYRLIVDGAWTIDPNSETIADKRGILVSRIEIPSYSNAPSPGTMLLPNGQTEFVYIGAPGSRVSLIGDFNRWDPYLTPMPESLVYPGYYTVSLRLPADTRHYRYVVDGKEIPDPGNPATSRNGWGEVASLLPQF